MINNVRVQFSIDRETECWEWGERLYPNGYGRFDKDGKTYMAHRVVYESEVGPIPDGLNLDHICGNKKCVNPKHLEPVTQAENIYRTMPEQREKVVTARERFFSNSWTLEQVCEFLGVKRQAALDTLNGSRWKYVDGPTRSLAAGKYHSLAKLTEDQVLEIYFHPRTVMQKDLAKQYGVSRSTIGNIWNKKGWKVILENLEYATR